MQESTSYTDVIDAFDEDDPFDLNAHLQFTRTSDRGTIEREFTNDAGQRTRTSVAESERTTSTLTFGLDIGLYRDVMAFVRLPLILSDNRSLSSPSGKSQREVQARLTDADDFASGSGSLFGVPFDSPTRAGFDYVGIGGSWAVLNQQRHAWQPTWTLLVEGRRAIGTPLIPCKREGGETVCGSAPASGQDIDLDGRPDGTNQQFAGDNAGSSRGVSGIFLETRVSRRYRYVEPYGGLGVLIEWPSTAKKYFNPAGNLEGVLNALPSRQASATLGSAIIPWENRATWQRFALDVRLSATYLSEGHDYTALFDALGTSNHAELARPNFEGLKGVDDPNKQTLRDCNGGEEPCYVGSKVPFYGLTDVQSRLKYGFRLGLEMQAAQYVRFAFGTALSWVTAHALTMADACNPNFADGNRNESYRGSTCAARSGEGIINPNHRPTIDLPGRRFWMTGELVVDLYATATAQF